MCIQLLAIEPPRLSQYTPMQARRFRVLRTSDARKIDERFRSDRRKRNTVAATLAAIVSQRRLF